MKPSTARDSTSRYAALFATTTEQAKHVLTFDNPAEPPSIANPLENALMIKFSGSHSLSLLELFAPEDAAAEIRTAQRGAATTSLKEIASCLMGGTQKNRGFIGILSDENGKKDQNINLGRESGRVESMTFHVFSTAISKERAPLIETTALLLSLDVRRTGNVGLKEISAAVDVIKPEIKEAYAGALDYFLSKAIGPFQRIRGADELRIQGVPQELSWKTYFEPIFKKNGSAEKQEDAFDYAKSYNLWSEQAALCGWGKGPAARLLRCLKAEQAFAERKSSIFVAATKVTHAIQKTSSGVGKLLGQLKGSPIEKAAQATREKLRGTKQGAKTAAKKYKHNGNFHSH